jgi:hypothetical protein
MAQFGLSWALLRREKTEQKKTRDIQGRVKRKGKERSGFFRLILGRLYVPIFCKNVLFFHETPPIF